MLALALLLAAPAVGQTTAKRKPTLREQLTLGLQARRPSEQAFVEAVADTVDRGDLRRDLVDRVFFWARSRPSRQGEPHRPIIYFQPALERIAAKGKVTIQTDAEAAAAAG